MKVGEKIRKIRELKGFKQEHIAKELGITQPNYSKLENDEIELSIYRLEEIAKILDVSTKELLEFDKNIFINLSSNHNGIVNNSPNNPISINDTKMLEEIIKSKEEIIAYQKDMITLLKKQIETLENQSPKTT